ncbi:HDOD domain-containing protein [Thiomicrorhabdus sp. 6S2-11]|uniref:HDOD domain-containing protein n=1 Tax=Thiomicrorhabdus marina TaxID=2818442 RepID=A0ABS3Q3M3_9GAMM|nr:HDOD domain-containing protein [Thiomicrorhabdus marina]MBO1926544.1 HDOD domain-containing protein [Thiomicrorhabdus marina]
MSLTMQQGISNAQKILENLSVDPMPQEFFELQGEMFSASPNMVKIGDIIGRHPKLLGQFLGSVNQRLKRPQDDLILDPHAAVNLLGLKEIEQLFLLSYLSSSVPKTHFDQELINRSKRASIAAAELSYWVNDIGYAEANLVSFLQDIGAIYMARAYGSEYLGACNQTQLNFPFSGYQKEMEKYQTAHTYLGSLIVHRWQLGSLLAKSVLLHHSKDLQSLQKYDIRVAHMVAMIQVANGLVQLNYYQEEETEELRESIDRAAQFLELPENAIKAAISVLEKWGDSCCNHGASH